MNLGIPGIENYFNLLFFNLSGAERDAKAGLEQEEQPAKKKEVVADAGEDTTRELVEETVVDVEEYDMTTHE